MTLFSEKSPIFTAKISDDPFFSHRPGFSDFPFFYQIFPFFATLNVVYDPFLTRKTPFLLFSYFPGHPTILHLKILGGRMHGPSPHLNFFWEGDRPTSPPRSPPLISSTVSYYT